MFAKPSSNFLPPSSPRETPSFAQSMSECTRKRKRSAEDEEFDPSNPQTQDEKNKTRRINPFKLAERLPAGLVKEMETFIKPGAIMPNFDIRKELQIRYQVDRRHLYDYFHSRGLRVAKEDRHSNLTRSRIAKAKAQVQGDEGAKENVPMKCARPIKLPPSKRSTPKVKPARKSIKKPAEAPAANSRFFCGSTSSITAYNQEQEAEIVYSHDDNLKLCFETEIEEVDVEPVEEAFGVDVRAAPTDVFAEVVEPQPCFYSEDAFASSGRSTPSLIDDSSSSCKSPTPECVQPDEESFSAAEFAAEFLNLPEDPESQDHSLDTVFDLSSVPSMIGDLMCPTDRKNMYEHIDTNIVSNGSSFALDLSALQPETPNLDSFLGNATLPLHSPSSSLELYIKALQSIASAIPSAVPASLPSSSTSNGYCVPPAALSNATQVFLPSDFLTPGFRQVDNVSFSMPGTPSAVSYPSLNPFHPALQNQLRTIYTGRST